MLESGLIHSGYSDIAIDREYRIGNEQKVQKISNVYAQLCVSLHFVIEHDFIVQEGVAIFLMVVTW